MNVYFLRMTIKTAGEISQRKVLFDKMSSSHRGTDPRRSGFSRSHSYRHSIDLAGQEIQASVLYRMQALKWRRQQRLIHWRPDQDSAGSCHTAGLEAFVSTPHTKQHSPKMSRYIQCMLTTTRCCIFNHQLVLSFAYWNTSQRQRRPSR